MDAMEHAHSIVLGMLLAAAAAAAAASFAGDAAVRAGDAAGARGLVQMPAEARLLGEAPGGGSIVLFSVSLANAGTAHVRSLEAEACGARGAPDPSLLPAAPGSHVSATWTAECRLPPGGRAVVRTSYALDDGTSGSLAERVCPGAPCAPAGAPPAAPVVATCAASPTGTVRICLESGGGIVERAAGGGFERAGATSGDPPCYAGRAADPAADAAYRIGAEGPAGGEPAWSRIVTAEFADGICIVDAPGGGRIGSRGGPPAPADAAPADYRVSARGGPPAPGSTVEARFGAHALAVEKLASGSWSRIGLAPSHPEDGLGEYLPADAVGPGADGGALVRYHKAALLRLLDEFWKGAVPAASDRDYNVKYGRPAPHWPTGYAFEFPAGAHMTARWDGGGWTGIDHPANSLCRGLPLEQCVPEELVARDRVWERARLLLLLDAAR